MDVFIANFGRENYLWPICQKRSVIATLEEKDLLPYWQASDREGYIDHCMATKKTSAGITPTRPVASRWFNLASIISSSSGDIWIHREKDELWWTTSHSGKPDISLEPAYRATKEEDNVYVFQKPADPWSNKNKRGNRLDWRSLHPKAREFLFTEGTLQRLSEDNTDYARALIEGGDLSPWHSRSEWQKKTDKSKKSPATIASPRERAAYRMADTAVRTAAASNGQEVARIMKEKNFRFSKMDDLADYALALIDSQDGLCAITGIPLQYDGEYDDSEMLCSLDRIDSNGHYEPGNLQVVCRFINRWKSDGKDTEFRRLVELVKDAGGFN